MKPTSEIALEIVQKAWARAPHLDLEKELVWAITSALDDLKRDKDVLELTYRMQKDHIKNLEATLHDLRELMGPPVEKQV